MGLRDRDRSVSSPLDDRIRVTCVEVREPGRLVIDAHHDDGCEGAAACDDEVGVADGLVDGCAGTQEMSHHRLDLRHDGDGLGPVSGDVADDEVRDVGSFHDRIPVAADADGVERRSVERCDVEAGDRGCAREERGVEACEHGVLLVVLAGSCP